MLKIFIALIHNNNEKRNTYIRPCLTGLRGHLLKQFKVESIEISYQPTIKPHGLLMSVLRDFYYSVLDYKWRRYLSMSAFLPYQTLAFIFRFVKKIVDVKKSEAWRKSSAIEMALADKHIRAWAAFLETGADYLVCFEDDAIFRSDSEQRLSELLKTLENKELSAIYVDLAGGCKRDTLKIDKLQLKQDSFFRYYKKPATNTACVYLISRPLIVAFYDVIIKRPHLRLIGADWLMNAIFIIMENANLNSDCMHADPTIFCHGSITGSYLSSIR